MKHKVKILLLCLLLFTVSGCSRNENSRNRTSSGSSVDKVISDQIDNASEQRIEDDGTQSSEPAAEDSGADESSQTEAFAETDASDTAGVDYDLTAMSSDMVYATVYQMMTAPNTYVGKTIRMEGLYYGYYYETTGQEYHYCVIQDALACCAQGLEFVWGDGSHIYPDEYPEENAEIVVQGVFETYQEDGDENLYCRLKDAALETADL